MSLSLYKKKRDFKKSPEPKGGKPAAGQLRFVIQKHAASHLHYDFRLEMEGVLKSWAVPKGPSTDPTVKRLAMQVEDHPFDYRNFEGIIPSGYGAGTVIIWDEGYYEPAAEHGPDKQSQDKALMAGLHAGKLHVILHGEKLKGEYGLIKVKGRGENGWLLFKVKDKYASAGDVTEKDRSVISKKTLSQMAKTSDYFYKAPPKKTAKKVVSKKATVKKTAATKRAGPKPAIKKAAAKKKQIPAT